MNQNLGKYLILAALAVLLIGILVYFFWDKLSWFGKLPGDISFERDNTKIYFPVVTMILISVLLNLIIYVVRRFL